MEACKMPLSRKHTSNSNRFRPKNRKDREDIGYSITLERIKTLWSGGKKWAKNKRSKIINNDK